MTNEAAANTLESFGRCLTDTGSDSCAEACRMGAAALRSPAPGAVAMREAAAQGGEPAHTRWNDDGVDYCGGCGRWMPEGTGRVAFDGTVICKGRPEKPLPAPEVPDDGINFHEAFGSAVWESLKARWVQGEMSDDDINLMELAEEAGLCEQVAYSPEHHGEIQDAEPGDMIFWWGGR